MIRTFIALDLPVGVRKALGELQEIFRKTGAHVGWVKPDRIHLTLLFLGNVPEEEVPEIQSALDEAISSVRPFTLQAKGCGAFPSIKQMRVVWVGLQADNEILLTLQKRAEDAMVTLGFEREDRPFKPHLTLGRVKGRRHLRELQEALMEHRSFEAEAFDVGEAVLYKSELRPEGAQYTALHRAKFQM